MKHIIFTTFLGVVGALLLPTAVADESTTLSEMLDKVQANADTAMDTRSLARDWIGDIADEDGKIERMRLEKGRIMDGEIALLRTYPNGSYLGSDAPVYIKSIPTNKKIRICSTVAEIKELLGNGRPSFSGWGGPKGIHSSHSWVCFSPSAENRLTYISVFAHTSFNEEQRAKGITQVNELVIRRGKFRPTNPTNQKEREVYLSGADMFAAEEAEKARKRQRYPQPLRDLILADEHPDDSDLKHLSATIQAIREAPHPKLFAQLVQEMDEGTLKIRSLLNHILLNEHELLDLREWRAPEEAIAVGACIDSLPLAKNGAKDDLVEIVLRVCGGGKIEIEGKNGGSSIEVIPAESGYRLILSGASDPLSLAEAQKELRRLYTKSKAEQDGADQPATAPDSNSEGNQNPKPESEGRSQ
ncbi:hypothetical protein [Persicirhabdus sediminis]|uniref:Secreted protein n=1 Tax=Persicirhabdus sediminis TaxID=454144 RepID=A0A8J7MHG4_9BACT|nr:hypothetical protein [Persicirhabdus sediminis]MBK1791989.1 hypothetical protein [Persicirhabdus sediminis]